MDESSLKAYIAAHPEAYLNEIAVHFNVTDSGISKALSRLKITRNKTSLYAERNEARRIEFVEIISQYPSEKLVYADESGIDKFISREYGRALKGQKIIGEISGKRYTRESFVAGLNKVRVIAPFCYKGTCDTKILTTTLLLKYHWFFSTQTKANHEHLVKKIGFIFLCFPCIL